MLRAEEFSATFSPHERERILIAAERTATSKWFIQKAMLLPAVAENRGIQFPIAVRQHRQRRAARRRRLTKRRGSRCRGQDGGRSPPKRAAADMCLQTHGGFGFAQGFDSAISVQVPGSTRALDESGVRQVAEHAPACEVVSATPSLAAPWSRSNRRSPHRCARRASPRRARHQESSDRKRFARGYDDWLVSW